MQQRHKKFCRHVGGSCRMLKTLNYDFRNLFVVFAATFAPVYCGQKYVSFPYCAPHFIPIIKGNLCAICELAVVFWVFRCRSRERKLRMILFNRKSSQFILVIATFKNSIWGWLCWIPWVFVIKEGASVQQLTLLDDYWKVNPCKPFNKGTSSAGMREAAAGCQKTELWLWLQKAFCWWCSNFYTYIPWSVRRMCPVHIVQHACSSHTRKSLPYMWACHCGFQCFWVLNVHLYFKKFHHPCIFPYQYCTLPLRTMLRDMAGQSLKSLGQTWGSS